MVRPFVIMKSQQGSNPSENQLSLLAYVLSRSCQIWHNYHVRPPTKRSRQRDDLAAGRLLLQSALFINLCCVSFGRSVPNLYRDRDPVPCQEKAEIGSEPASRQFIKIWIFIKTETWENFLFKIGSLVSNPDAYSSIMDPDPYQFHIWIRCPL